MYDPLCSCFLFMRLKLTPTVQNWLTKCSLWAYCVYCPHICNAFLITWVDDLSMMCVSHISFSFFQSAHSSNLRLFLSDNVKELYWCPHACMLILLRPFYRSETYFMFVSQYSIVDAYHSNLNWLLRNPQNYSNLLHVTEFSSHISASFKNLKPKIERIVS